MNENVVIFPATTSLERSGENQSYTYCGGGRMWRGGAPLSRVTILTLPCVRARNYEIFVPTSSAAAAALAPEVSKTGVRLLWYVVRFHLSSY